MPRLVAPLTRNSTGKFVASLHTELRSLGAIIPPNELTAKRFGEGTEKAVREFQQRHGLPETGKVDVLFGRLTGVVSIAIDGNRKALRAAVRESVSAAPGSSPQLNYWFAHYAILAGDYQTAHTIAIRFPGFDPLAALDTAVLDGSIKNPRAPEVSNPENFYTYRHEVLPELALSDLKRGVNELTLAQYKLDLGIPATTVVNGPDFENARQASLFLLDALQEWQSGIQSSFNRQYERAAVHYESCQRAVVGYFDRELEAFNSTGDLNKDLDSVLGLLVSDFDNSEGLKWSLFWEAMRWRRFLLSLKELHEHDWLEPRGSDTIYSVAGMYVSKFFLLSELLSSFGKNAKTHAETRVIAPLVLIALVFVPLARAEDNRMRRQYDAALQELDKLLALNTGLAPKHRLLCEFIEIPFIRLLRGQTLLDKAEGQFKARILVTPADTFPEASEFSNMLAAKTYLAVFTTFHSDEEEQYVSQVLAARKGLIDRIAQGNTQGREFDVFVKGTTIPVASSSGGTLPGLDRRPDPHERLVEFTPPAGQDVMRETNPKVYALLLEAQARLEQLRARFNYFGYLDNYVPPWRFQFLLDRARYFAEHAKNTQREYLNFLGNAEREEFQELSATQNVEMEKSNVRVEGARVDQAGAEVNVADQSAALARLSADDSALRLVRYLEFDRRMDDLESRSLGISVLGGFVGVVAIAATGGAAAGGFAAAAFFANSISAEAETTKAGEQRALEKHNLALAIGEAQQAAAVAAARLASARAGLLVAGLQRQAALLRHEFAIQNLTFLRNRTLNAELWYRLSAAIRSVSDTYLRYGIEMAFLAEQAYEFEADKRLDVIRFDYDASDLGAMLAGDFLLNDLDTLEQDLIVEQKIRQQQVRYVLSLAGEYPEALQELRNNGQMTFCLRLEQLERRFPGLFNLRISSVDVLPVALMDSRRFGLELTHLGSGQVRLHAQPTMPDEPLGTDWLTGLEADWSIKLRSTGSETAIFSGLARQDLGGSATFFAANQRGAFEGLAGASAWKIDLSMKENRIVPDTLADLVITFTISGYYDNSLRDAIDHAPRKALATTTWFAAQQSFPDSFYEFNRTGRMDWQITPDFLALQGSLGELQNVAVVCLPSQRRPDLGRLICSYPIEFEIDATGTVRMLRELPRITFTANGLVLNAGLNTTAGSSVTFDFGDGTGVAGSAALPHSYAKPGRYDVLVRIAANGRLTEYRAAVVVSRQHNVLPPCVVIPVLDTTFEAGKIKLRPSLESTTAEPLSVTWRIENQAPDEGTGPVTFTLTPGRYVVRVSAIRSLTARFYSQQRFLPSTTLPMKGLHLATNRTFDVATEGETTAGLNAFGEHLFGAGALAATDRWTLELPLDDNPSVLSVSSSDGKQHDLSELADVFLALEYKIKDE